MSTAEEEAQEKQQIILQAMANEYQTHLEESMGKLHNQFIAFISSSALPIPQVLLVLKMVEKETIDLAFQKFLGKEEE